MEPGLGLEERTARLLRRRHRGAEPWGRMRLPATSCSRSWLPPCPAPPNTRHDAALLHDYNSRHAPRRHRAPLPAGTTTPVVPRGAAAFPRFFLSSLAPLTMAAAEAALARWARAEMELPPALAPPGPVLRRLCSGSCAPIWEFVTRHVRHPRNVQKIRGNLLWYRHLQEMEGAGPALREAVSSLRQELGGWRGPWGAQEAALELEAALEAGLSRRRAGLRRGAELRLLEGRQRGRGSGCGGREALRPPG
ncbi:uncharacterized protein [Ciconia boyciana]|uniref:uncharacterized protein n=1 Tax=Ciconia boyciana TaxID=52775 RepID=UPI003BA28CEA